MSVTAHPPRGLLGEWAGPRSRLHAAGAEPCVRLPPGAPTAKAILTATAPCTGAYFRAGRRRGLRRALPGRQRCARASARARRGDL